MHRNRTLKHEIDELGICQGQDLHNQIEGNWAQLDTQLEQERGKHTISAVDQIGGKRFQM